MFWDRVAGVYDLFAYFYNKKVNEELCRKTASLIEKDDSVLDCACGTGMITKIIAPNCKEVTATDISEGMLERMKKKCAAYKNVTVRKADILHLPFPDSTFDKVIAANVIHLLDEPEKALKELLRVCREDGMIILPTYVNKKDDGDITVFSKTVGKAGADFKKEFTLSSYEAFLKEEGVEAEVTLIKGRVPCAFALIRRNHETQKL